MEMTLRWYGSDYDTVTLEQIRQIPGVTGVITTLYGTSPGDIRLPEENHALKKEVEAKGLHISGIEKVYVEEGDEVKKGEVLAEVSLGEIDLELSEIQYQFDRNTILLRQTQEDMKLAVDRIVTTGTSMIEEEKRAYAKNLATVQQTYEYQIEDYQDKVTVLSTKLSFT